MTDKVIVRESSPVVVREEVTEKVVVVTGTQGPKGEKGDPGPAGDAVVFIQPDQPADPGYNYVWVQTQIGVDNDMTFWVEDGT